MLFLIALTYGQIGAIACAVIAVIGISVIVVRYLKGKREVR